MMMKMPQRNRRNHGNYSLMRAIRPKASCAYLVVSLYSFLMAVSSCGPTYLSTFYHMFTSMIRRSMWMPSFMSTLRSFLSTFWDIKLACIYSTRENGHQNKLLPLVASLLLLVSFWLVSPQAYGFLSPFTACLVASEME